MRNITDLRDLSAYYLTSLIETSGPSGLESLGAAFLTSVRDAYVEWLEEETENNPDFTDENFIDAANDAARDWTDACIPVYTWEVWTTFVDLHAYHYENAEDAFELTPGDPTGGASYTLACMAADLFVALASLEEN